MNDVDVTVLGPVRAFDGDREVDLGGPRGGHDSARVSVPRRRSTRAASPACTSTCTAAGA